MENEKKDTKLTVLIAIVAILISALSTPPCRSQGTWYSPNTPTGALPYVQMTGTSLPNVFLWSQNGINDEGTGTVASINGTATLAPVLYFVPTTTGAAPPANIIVLESGNATTETAWSFNFMMGFMTPTFSANVDDGLSDPVVWTDPTSYETIGTSAGKHLLTNKVTPATGTVPGTSLAYTGTVTLPNITWQYSESVTPPANINGIGIEGSAGISIAADTRTVVLYRQGATGETVDASGTTHGDTLYSSTDYTQLYDEYGLPAGTSSDWAPNWQVYLPAYSGTWGWITGTNHEGMTEDVPNATWAWAPNESQDTWDWGTMEAPAGTITYLDGSSQGTPDSPTMKTITFTATSNVDGAIAKAIYDITYHVPYDAFTSVTPSQVPAIALVTIPPLFCRQNNTVVLEGGPSFISMEDGQQVDFGMGPAVVETFLELAGGVLLCSTDPPIFFIGLCAEASGMTGSDEAAQVQNYPYSPNEAQFDADCETQKAINAGQTAGILMPGITRVTANAL